jgi:hypothetical protein
MTPTVSGFFPAAKIPIHLAGPGCRSRAVAGTIDSLFELYATRCSEGDLQGIASLWVALFFGVRKGQ